MTLNQELSVNAWLKSKGLEPYGEEAKRKPKLSDLIEYFQFVLDKGGDDELRYCIDKYDAENDDVNHMWELDDLICKLGSPHDNIRGKYHIGG
jgi:hypothetical protein